MRANFGFAVFDCMAFIKNAIIPLNLTSNTCTHQVKIAQMYIHSPKDHRVISNFQGRQLIGDISHKASNRLPLLSNWPLLHSKRQSVITLRWYLFLLLDKEKHMYKQLA